MIKFSDRERAFLYERTRTEYEYFKTEGDADPQHKTMLANILRKLEV